MSHSDLCSCRGVCLVLLLIAIILGIITTALIVSGLVPTFTAVFPFVAATALGILLFLGGLLVFNASMFRANIDTHCNVLRCVRNCICDFAICLLIAALGALVLTIILLTFPLVVTALLSQIFIFVYATLFWWMVLSFFGLLVCIIRCLCDN